MFFYAGFTVFITASFVAYLRQQKYKIKSSIRVASGREFHKTEMIFRAKIFKSEKTETLSSPYHGFEVGFLIQSLFRSRNYTVLKLLFLGLILSPVKRIERLLFFHSEKLVLYLITVLRVAMGRQYKEGNFQNFYPLLSD